MKKIVFTMLTALSITGMAFGQKVNPSAVPAAVKSALMQKYPTAAKITWEKEKGNFEANWGGKSGEGMSVIYTPAATFVEQVSAIPVSQLPAGVAAYVKANYKGAKISEAGKVTDAKGALMYEAEVKRKDLVFDENGKFIKVD